MKVVERVDVVADDALCLGAGRKACPIDRISRVGSLVEEGTSNGYVDYSYVGASLPVIAHYRVPNVRLTRFHASNGMTTTGQYPGLDRYGRIARQMWVDGAFAAHGTLGSVPNRPPIVEMAYLYDNASSRTGAFDARPGSRLPLSQSYSYDGLHRLTEAIRGAWNGSLTTPSVTQLRNGQEWSLDPLGNWLEVATDLDGAGGFDVDEVETRDFLDAIAGTNRVNELYARTLAADAGGDDLALTYDFAGNILRQELTNDGTDTTALRYTHDAWNRLVKVEFEDEEEDLHPRGEYEYNGLNWRTIARADTDTTDSTHALDELRTMYYSHEWRLLEVRVDADYQSSAGTNSHVQHVWGERYIDDIVSTRHDPDPSAEDGYEVAHFHLTDAQFSTVALTGSDGALLERVSYTAYGVARHHWRGDVNGDGAVDSADLAIVFGAFGDSIDDAGYRAEVDLFPDGTIDAADSAIVLGGWQAALPAGVLSSPLVDNRIGYCGYVFAPETQTYLVRFRWDLPPLGRWGQRDPAGYVDGMNLYEYVRSKPATLADPLGLDAIECPPNLKGRCHCRAVKVAVVSGGADPDFLKDVKGYFETVGKAGYILDLVSGNVLGLAYSLGTADVPAAALDRIERHLRDLGGVDVWIYMGHRCCRCGHWRWLSPPGSVAPLKMPLYDCSDCRYYDEPAPPERSAIRCRPPSRAGTLEFFERFLAEEARQPDVILRCIRQAIDACGDQLDLDLSR